MISEELNRILMEREEEILSFEDHITLVENDYTQIHNCVILKSCYILMIYNFIESTVKNCFLLIQEMIIDDGCDFIELKGNFKKLFLCDVKKRRDEDLIKVIENPNNLIKSIKISLKGNLDIEKIAQEFRLYGLKIKYDMKEKMAFRIIKDKRNDLAHGVLAFSNATRDYPLPYLKDLRGIVFKKIQGIVKQTCCFTVNRKYVAKR